MEYNILSWNFLFISVVMTLAGFIDSLAGGGGVLRLPAYLAFGLNPALILGTNKLASTMGIVISAYKLRGRLTISKKLLKVISILAFTGAVIGAALSRLLNPDWLAWIIIIIAPLMAYFIISSGSFGRVETRLRIGVKKSDRAAEKIAFLVAVYDGFLGPGAGTMYAVFLTKYCGFEILQATAISKILNFCSNLFAMLFFLAVGATDIKLGLIMGIFSIIGNILGVYVGKRHGAAVIRPLIILVCALIVIKFFYDYFYV
ncbi:MAG: TSUP family transporter [Elusimicrobiota bacterium]|jgi:uncharacterized membrane protein YfcA|nr:TSUP family transporter [Elusimicrobiota bacterium]